MSGRSDSRVRIINEVRAMQDDQRYGCFTHPVMLGLLIAADMLDVPAADTDTADPSENETS